MNTTTQNDLELLRMARIGFEQQRRNLDQRIAEIDRTLSGRAKPAGEPDPAPTRTRPRLSAAARARISAAQKKRWANHKKAAAA